MSINPNDYVGANLTIVGFAGGEPEEKSFNGGGSVTELSVSVGKGYKDKNSGEWIDQGTDWYTLSAAPQYAEDNWPVIGKGDKVRIDDARLELKPFTKKDGTPAVDARLRFGTVTVVEAKNERASAGSSKKSYEDVTPF